MRDSPKFRYYYNFQIHIIKTTQKKKNDHQSFFVYRDALEENHANLDDLEIKIEKATRLLY